MCLTVEAFSSEERLEEREQRGFQSLSAVDRSNGKSMLDEPRLVDSPADSESKCWTA